MSEKPRVTQTRQGGVGWGGRGGGEEPRAIVVNLFITKITRNKIKETLGRMYGYY